MFSSSLVWALILFYGILFWLLDKIVGDVERVGPVAPIDPKDGSQ